MTDQQSRAALLVALGVAGLLGGYYLGFVPLDVASQAGDAASDLLVPADGFRSRRLRREAIRSELQRVTEFETRFRAENGDYARPEDVPEGPPGFVLKAHWRPKSQWYQPLWMGEMSHGTSPRGEACAVSIDKAPAYVAGIPLKRTGQIRCTWDLATRINRLLHL